MPPIFSLSEIGCTLMPNFRQPRRVASSLNTFSFNFFLVQFGYIQESFKAHTTLKMFYLDLGGGFVEKLDEPKIIINLYRVLGVVIRIGPTGKKLNQGLRWSGRLKDRL